MTETTAPPPTFGHLVRGYLEHEDDAHLQRLRRAVVEAPTFDPDLDVITELGPLMQQGEHRRVVLALSAKMPGAALNPSAHAMLSEALRGTGDDRAATREDLMARLSVASILATGDGTRERPWSVLRVADEYDVLRARGVTPVSQRAEVDGARMLDRHETEDGGELWFAVETPPRTGEGVR